MCKTLDVTDSAAASAARFALPEDLLESTAQTDAAVLVHEVEMLSFRPRDLATLLALQRRVREAQSDRPAALAETARAIDAAVHRRRLLDLLTPLDAVTSPALMLVQILGADGRRLYDALLYLMHESLPVRLNLSGALLIAPCGPPPEGAAVPCFGAERHTPTFDGTPRVRSVLHGGIPLT